MKRAILAAGMLALSVFPATTSATTTPTGFTGGSAPFSQYQPSLVLQQFVATQGVYPSRDGGGGTEDLGMVRTYAGTNDAFGAPAAQGQLLQINVNTALFSLLGTNFGGNGQTSYALPDLTGRTAVGAGNGPDQAYFVGMQTGAPTTVLSVANLPAHDHSVPGGGVTSVTGSGTAFDNHEPSLTLTEMIAVTGVFPSRSGGTPPVFLGEIGQFAGDFAPGGWLPADGRLLQIDQNAALFAIIGTTYGGDGDSTFALPDLRGRTAVGVGQGIGLAAVALGEQFGTASTSLTLSQMPVHDHTLPGGGMTGSSGGGAPVDTHQPSLGLTYIIALQGVFPSSNGGFPDTDAYLGEVLAFAGDFAPGGWAAANGQLLSINQNQALFALLGTTYGGDGRTTFALPDLRGRSIIGAGNGFVLGTAFGTDTTILTAANLADHDHTVTTDSVPEPATWALLIAGFGMTGTAIRRRTRAIRQS